MINNNFDKNVGTDATSGEDEHESEDCKTPIWLFWRSRRYIVTILVFFGLFNDYALRVNMSVAIVDMTQLKNITLENGTVSMQKDFDWDTKTQGHILSSFYYGYLLTQLLGGYLSTRFGGKPVFSAGIGGIAVLHLFTPWLSRLNVYILIIVITAEGLFGGIIFPCISDIFAKWTPFLEKSRLVTIGFSGCYMGTLVSLSTSSMLATCFGWEIIFYVFGIFGCTWTIFWVSLVSNSPQDDSKITKAELKYITNNAAETTPIDELNIPWSCILTSVPVWALTIAVACKAWGFFTLLTHLPKFVKYCLNYDLKEAGFISAVPYLAMSVMLQLAGQVADIVETKKLLTTTQMRKIFVVFGLLVQSIFMALAVHWISIFGSYFCLIMAVGLGGFTMAVFTVNPLDLSPRYGSIIGAINHTFATISGIIAPTVTGYIVTEETNVGQWKTVFYLASFIYFLGALIFGCFGSGKLQSWNSCITQRHDNPIEIKHPPNYIDNSLVPEET